jgi:hypothetical protein
MPGVHKRVLKDCSLHLRPVSRSDRSEDMSRDKKPLLIAITIIAVLCAIAFNTTNIFQLVLLLFGVLGILAFYALWNRPFRDKGFPYQGEAGMNMAEAEIMIGSFHSQYLQVRPKGRTHPECTDWDDGNWLNTSVNVSVGGFNGSFVASLRADEFSRFHTELKLLRDNQVGTAAFSSMEDWLSIEVTCDSLGHFRAKCEAGDDAGGGNVLKFELAFDQTELLSILRGLREIEETFPVIGTPPIHSLADKSGSQ